jgi:nucleoside-diphosphate-sugar epimerase
MIYRNRKSNLRLFLIMILTAISVMLPTMTFAWIRTNIVRITPIVAISEIRQQQKFTSVCHRQHKRSNLVRSYSSSSSFPNEDSRTKTTSNNNDKGTILVLGGTGYLGQNVCREAAKFGYNVISLSRRGLPSSKSTTTVDDKYLAPQGGYVDYRSGDARKVDSIQNILFENNNGNNIVGIVHCIGLLFDSESGIGEYNIYVSGSGSIPDSESTYDKITRETAFNAIDCATQYAKESITVDSNDNQKQQLPFVFTSAAEAGWPEMIGGQLIEALMPEFLKRYLIAKRAVESKLLSTSSNEVNVLRPIIVRPSLIYSPMQLASLPSVATFTIANKIGVPFVDRPVTVQSLAQAIIQSISDNTVTGIQRYQQIDTLYEQFNK